MKSLAASTFIYSFSAVKEHIYIIILSSTRSKFSGITVDEEVLVSECLHELLLKILITKGRKDKTLFGLKKRETLRDCKLNVLL